MPLTHRGEEEDKYCNRASLHDETGYNSKDGCQSRDVDRMIDHIDQTEEPYLGLNIKVILQL